MKKLNQVLIVDDDEVSNLFCRIVIEHAGITDDAHACTSVLEAFDYLAACINSGIPAPELILMDIDMPEKDGFDFLEHYQKLGYTRSLSTKICILTTPGQQSDSKALLGYPGVIDYVVKPLSEESLKRLMARFSSPYAGREFTMWLHNRAHRFRKRS